MQALFLKDPVVSETDFESGVRDSFPACSVMRYTPDLKSQWNGFLPEAKNATFLFHRDYMDYHHDRFIDHSLMIYRGNTLVGLLPGNLAADGRLVSHEGLTYGGLIVSRAAMLKEVAGCLYSVMRYLNEEQISKWVYKRIPTFYNTIPDDDVAYALFLVGARLYRRDCAMTISEGNRLPCIKSRRALINKTASFGISFVQETSFQPFWDRVLVPQLAARYGVKPVHTVQEISLLAARFPENIKQFSSYCGDEIVSGATIYETPTVAHLQYAAVTDKGRRMGAQAGLFNWMIDHYHEKNFFDFGTSNESDGRVINHGLLRWKEGFGARCYTHDYYEVTTANYGKLEPILEGKAEVFFPPHEWEAEAECEGLRIVTKG
jgi:Acetyltransferase (GNAT) domain